MRDIRVGLEERLENIQTERGTLKKRLEFLDKRERAIRDILADEVARLGSREQQPLFPTPKEIGGETNLSNFVLEMVADGLPWTLEALKEVAENRRLFEQHKSPGRALNFALVGLQRRGLVERLDDGSWKLKENAPPEDPDGAS